MTIPGFELLEEVVRSDWHVVRRGRRRADGLPVLLKTPLDPRPRTAGADLLAREHEMLRALTLPGAPRVYELVRHDGRCALVLEDGGGISLAARLLSWRPDLGSFLALGIRLCGMLGGLHRQDIIHKGLTPRSILLHPVTGEAWLVDWSLASRASEGGAAPLPLHRMRGALPYMSPEQTGRMNRTADHRSDFYSLGILFYELLTGAPPFRSDDLLELIHRHIAQTAPSPSEVDPRIPDPVSRVVMKLLAKAAEERYQSARGLARDLERCRREWADHGRIAPFALGQGDVSDRFLIPQKLYGRDEEVEALLAAFDRTCAGPAALMLVAGYSGIGKTSLIQELYKPIVRQRGSFIAGKFDQVVRNMPYGALIQALRGLVQQLLTEGEADLALWRARLSEALGPNGGVVAEVIPEIELILGKLAPAPPLGPTEAQNRFHLVFQSFLGTLARREHPLVIFLDDLQWADSATLSLLEPLLTSPDIQFLFLIGAYRDNEVDAGHALTRALDALEAAGASLHRIFLGPLRLADLAHLVQDTLGGEPVDVAPLARLVLEKTAGNPFFVIQFLKALREDGLLEFDDGRGRWTFRMEAIGGAAMTDNVIDLMTRKIQRLAPRTRDALTLAACIGSRFDLDALATISRGSPESAAIAIREALDEGLVLTARAAYAAAGGGEAGGASSGAVTLAFLHDRVQQAAYGLIPEERRQLVHLTVGRLLLDRQDAARLEDRLFDVVHHLNLGSALIVDAGERLALARLNLAAARKAKSSTANQVALSYLRAGLGLLSADRWDSEYDLMLALHLEAAECEYLCGLFEEAERDFDRLLERARTRLDKARVHYLRILQYEHMSRYADAIRVGREGLALFGLSFPDSAEEKQRALDEEVAAIQRLMADRAIDALVDLPPMQDPEIRMVMRLRANLHTSCFLSGDKILTLLNTSAMVRLSLVHGNAEESAYAYALHAAMLVGPIAEDHQAAHEFGLVALRLSERLDTPALRAKVLMMFAWAISIWRMPIAASFPHTREAFRLGHETGLFVDAAWALFNESWFALLAGPDLEALQKRHAANVEYMRRIKMHRIAEAQQVILQWALALRGLTVHPLSLTDATFDEESYRQTFEGQRLFEMFYVVAKLAVLYTLGEHHAAGEAAERAATVIRRDFTGTIWDELTVFYHALTLAALHGATAPAERPAVETTLAALNVRLGRWADSAPANFRAQHLMVSAEIARLRGQEMEAVRLYQAALEAAAGSECPRERALAGELCARFWREREQPKVAAAFMADARDAYAEWGAAAKVEQLERVYPDLLERAAGSRALSRPPVGAPSPPPAEGEAGMSLLDLVTVMKAAQAIVGEIELDALLEKLMRIAIENAGAERGSLILEQDGEPLVYAEGTAATTAVRAPSAVPAGSTSSVAATVVNYVRRTSQSVVLADAPSDDRFATDPYIVRHRPRSILCAPVLHQGRLIGVFYLENNMAVGAFTPDRIQVMQLLSSQAAIALENARLYDEMRREVAQRRQAEEGLRVALAEVERLKNRLEAENVYLQEEIRGAHNFEEMVGSSPALLDVLRRVERVAPTDATVLIHGETGTGKELIARALHNRSRRKDRPLVKVNCGAIPAGLVESELFGHVKGAFTGALERRIGRFELADGGTLFLDEVSELPPETQVKLLRVLQEPEFEPVGSSRTVRVDVRIIAASNRDLEEAVRAGRFRSDLFYRLNVFPLRVPPVRERRSDVPLLVMFFIQRFSKKFGKRIDGVSQETMDLLVGYPWPGNVRELQNVIERGVVLSPGPILSLDRDLLPAVWGAESERSGTSPGIGFRPLGGAGSGSPLPPDPTSPDSPSLEDVERRHIAAVLARTAGVIEGPKGAARLLGLHPNTLRSRMKKLGIRRTDHDIS